MKMIPLSQGLFAMVDDGDYDELSAVKWHATRKGNTFYAQRSVVVDGKQTSIKMHRVIMGRNADGLETDHRDGDGLNNQRANLRACSQSSNQHNQRKRRDNTTGFKGVSAPNCRSGSVNKYTANIRVNGRIHHLGGFPTAEVAHAAYCEAAKRMCGEFARFA